MNPSNSSPDDSVPGAQTADTDAAVVDNDTSLDDVIAEPQDANVDILEGVGKQLLSRIGEIDVANLVTGTGDDDASNAVSTIDEGDRMEELADDMLDMIKRIKNVEDVQQRIADAFEQLSEAVTQQTSTVGREIDRMRREVVGSQKHQASMSIFNTLVPTLDRFREMRRGLNPGEDTRMISQLTAVVESLVGAMRGLGCNEFQVEAGQAFEPAWMECLGYRNEGIAGTVHSCVRPGFTAGESLVRPAGVMVVPVEAADKETGTEEKSSDE